MKDISLVLLEKEQDIVRVRCEIEALRLVIPLLADENAARAATGEVATLPGRSNRWPLEIQS
jgi:hypothetical protein